MNQIETIEKNCEQLSKFRARLRAKFEARQKAVNAATKSFDDEIRDLQSQCAVARALIEAQVSEARAIFLKPKQPKTRILFGIEVGFAKERNKTVWPEESELVNNIETLLPAKQAETLLNRKTTIIKEAVKKLAKDIKQKLGIRTIIGVDSVVVRTNDDDIEELVKKSLGEDRKA